MSIKDFAKKLKKARIESGLSQRSLGLSIGMSDKTISSYEASRSYPSLDILKKLSEVLKKPADYFLSSEYDEDLVTEDVKNLMHRNKELEKEISVLRKILSKEE